ncbi:MAG: HAMP domain-containing histidine kinase [Oscillospiraceae bacterium]|nr:HAMP domain-containing histidine kinase [Oscillospiraceae bacterium]
MKSRRISLTLRTFCTLLLFAAITLLVMALMQTVFLDDFYENIKRRSLNSAAGSMLGGISLDDAALQQLAQDTAAYYNVCILVTDEQMNTVASAEGAANCGVHRLGRNDLFQLYERTVQAGGSESYSLAVELPQPPSSIFTGQTQQNSRVTLSSLLKISVVTSDTAGIRVIFANAVTTPLGDTVQAIRMQLLVISLIMLVIAALLAVVFSRRITRPILNMNSEAAKLGEGSMDVHFSEQTGSRELDELGKSLNLAAEELARVETLRKELLANVSHDLRTPLTLITGYSEMMRDLPGENTPENLQLIITETKRLSSLVNDVLDISKYSDSGALSPARFCITDEVQTTIDRLAKLTEQEGFRFTFAPQQKVYVVADRTAISRVLYNLLTNAISYSGDSRTIEVYQSVQDTRVRLDICDHGAGIAAEELPYVFDRYYRSRENHVRAVVGSGLGLSIVKGILQAHDAQFGVDSALGSGSRFWFSLPVA